MSIDHELAQRAAAALTLQTKKQGNLDLLTWAALYRNYLRLGVPFDLVRHRYMVDVYRCTSPEMVLFKASQMGASEYAVSYAIHACDVRGATVLYIFPTATHISDFSSARIGPAVEASSYLQEIVGGYAGKDQLGRMKADKKTDRVTLRRIRNNFLYLRGGTVSPYGNAPQLKSIDADVVVMDEVDEMDSRVIPLAEKRIGHSEIAEQRYISTPTYSDVGIHALYVTSDQRQWFIPCQHCGHKQVLGMAHIVTEWDSLERPIDWHGRSESRAYAACEKCGKEIDRLGAGEWVPAYPGRDRAGFHLSRVFSPHANLLPMIMKLRDADETARKEAYNQDWGLPYTPRGGRLTDNDLDACRRDYLMGPVDGDNTYMGVDVGRVLHVVIRSAVAYGDERPLRLATIVDGFRDLYALIDQYKVRRTVIDIGPETRAAREFQESMPAGRVMLGMFTDLSKERSPIQHDPRRYIVNLDRTRLLDILLGRFVGRLNLLPADIKERTTDYYSHLKTLTRIIDTQRSGYETARYISSGPDHYAFAELYCHVAAEPMTQVIPGIVSLGRIKGWGTSK